MARCRHVVRVLRRGESRHGPVAGDLAVVGPRLAAPRRARSAESVPVLPDPVRGVRPAAGADRTTAELHLGDYAGAAGDSGARSAHVVAHGRRHARQLLRRSGAVVARPRRRIRRSGQRGRGARTRQHAGLGNLLARDGSRQRRSVGDDDGEFRRRRDRHRPGMRVYARIAVAERTPARLRRVGRPRRDGRDVPAVATGAAPNRACRPRGAADLSIAVHLAAADRPGARRARAREFACRARWNRRWTADRRVGRGRVREYCTKVRDSGEKGRFDKGRRCWRSGDRESLHAVTFGRRCRRPWRTWPQSNDVAEHVHRGAISGGLVRDLAPQVGALPGSGFSNMALFFDPWRGQQTKPPNSSRSMRCAIAQGVADRDTVRVGRAELDRA